MKKNTLLLICLVQSLIAFPQYVQIDHHNTKSNFTQDKTAPGNEPELFKNGFLDFLSNGNLQASARVLKLYIGNPKGFNVPLLIYSGVAGQTFGDKATNKTTVANLLNPVGGIVNISFFKSFAKDVDDTYTKVRFDIHAGGRMLNGTDTVSNTNNNFFNGYANAGVYFQTGAWAESSTTVGIFWLQAKVIASGSSKPKLENMFGTLKGDYLFGYSFDGGLEIDKIINVKLSYCRYTNNNTSGLLDKPVFKVSLDYNFNKD